MNTRDCAVIEVSVMDPQGSEAFRVAMEKLVQKNSLCDLIHVQCHVKLIQKNKLHFFGVF